MNSLTGEGLTFKEIERIFFEIGCEIAKTLIGEFLERLDDEICKNRNKAELRHKGTRGTSIKTLMGEVPLNRVLYKRFKEDGSSEYVFLLDKKIGLDTIGLISPNLVEKALEKKAFAGYMKPDEFKALRDAAVAKKYNVDEITYRVLNGDGAARIRNGHDLETDIFQLDPYHLSKSVIRNVSGSR